MILLWYHQFPWWRWWFLFLSTMISYAWFGISYFLIPCCICSIHQCFMCSYFCYAFSLLLLLFAVILGVSSTTWVVSVQFSSVQLPSHVRLVVTPWITAHQASLSITNSQSSPRLMSIESVMPSSHLILCRPLLLLPPIPPSIRVFSNDSNLHMRWPKYWSFTFSIIPSKEISGLISFKMDLLDLLEVQGTLKSLLQHHRSKASILRHSAFFTVQLSHLYMITGKTIALTRWTFVGQSNVSAFEYAI